MSTTLLPGRPYRISVAAKYKGKRGPYSYYYGRTKPNAPVITSVRNVSTKSFRTVAVSLQWTIDSAEFLDHFDLSYQRKMCYCFLTYKHRRSQGRAKGVMSPQLSSISFHFVL